MPAGGSTRDYDSRNTAHDSEASGEEVWSWVEHNHRRAIRLWLVLFMAGLVLSGVTAFPLETELHWASSMLETSPVLPIAEATHLLPWIERVHLGLSETNARFPLLGYGTDWLAFAHLILAALFIGPYRDPVRNQWVITFGLIACGAVIPLAFIAGHLRGIPIPWQLIDCSFGVFGAIPLLRCVQLISALEHGRAPAKF